MNKSNEIIINNSIKAGKDNDLLFLLGPCVMESEKNVLKIAEKLKLFEEKFNINIIFKASFDKANRTSINSFRGVGLEKGMEIFTKVKDRFNFPTITDIHDSSQAEKVADYVDIIQIPAFLARQTDLVVNAAKTGKCINLKKPQFFSPWEMEHVCKKVEDAGNKNYFITDRGTIMGYNRLVNDMKYYPYLKKFAPLCFDATHSVQLPGNSSSTGGEPQYVENLVYSAIAGGIDILFMETHFSREEAKSDSTNLILLDDLEILIPKVIKMHKFMKNEILY